MRDHFCNALQRPAKSVANAHATQPVGMQRKYHTALPRFSFRAPFLSGPRGPRNARVVAVDFDQSGRFKRFACSPEFPPPRAVIFDASPFKRRANRFAPILRRDRRFIPLRQHVAKDV
jgi:hypothetical protein